MKKDKKLNLGKILGIVHTIYLSLLILFALFLIYFKSEEPIVFLLVIILDFPIGLILFKVGDFLGAIFHIDSINSLLGNSLISNSIVIIIMYISGWFFWFYIGKLIETFLSLIKKRSPTKTPRQ